MRIVVLIVMVLTFLVGGLMSAGLTVNIGSKLDRIDYEEIAKMQKMIDEYKANGVDLSTTNDPAVKEALEQLDNVPSKTRAQIAGILGVLLSIVALVMVIIAFMKKEVVKKIGYAVISMAAFIWILTPSIDGGRLSGANPKTIALITLFVLGASAACAIISKIMHAKKSQSVQA